MRGRKKGSWQYEQHIESRSLALRVPFGTAQPFFGSLTIVAA
jgi:hypothetical protein